MFLKKTLTLFLITPFTILLLLSLFPNSQTQAHQNIIIKTYNIKGNSMYPTLKNGDKVQVNLNAEYLKKRDIVIFKFKTRDDIFVKRVIANEEDIIVFGKDGFIYVNNKKLNESYVNGLSIPKPDKLKILLIQLEYYNNTIPKGSILVMGDNRANSFDSSNYGLIPKDYVLGKIIE